MNTPDIIKGLLSMARQSRDAATANEAGTAAHMAEFDRLLVDKTPAAFERRQELYAYIVHWPQDARRLRREENILTDAAALLLAGVANEEEKL